MEEQLVTAKRRKKLRAAQTALLEEVALPKNFPPSLFYEQIGVAVWRQRKKLGFNQEVVAKYVGLSRASITNIEGGRQRVPLHVLVRLGELFACDYRELLPEVK